MRRRSARIAETNVTIVQGVQTGMYAVEDNCGTCDNDPENDCIKIVQGTWGGDCSRRRVWNM